MRLFIVDDEPLARERLKRLVAELPDTEVVGEAGNGLAALGHLPEAQADVVLLDIRMPGMDGLECARHLSLLPEPPAVIFTTAYGEYALEAFRVHAAGYLVKPVRVEELAEALRHCKRLTRPQLAQLAADQGSPRRSHISARVRGQIVLVPMSEIYYFQADQKYVTVRHAGGELLIEEALKGLEDEFGDLLVRIHRNALIMREQIAGLTRDAEGKQYIRLRHTDELLEVSRRHSAELRHLLKEL
ncbi:MAG: response regulator transcription factor [Gammaproteobacteria bacterium]|nr:response regulator transcription factor [Gammaproteobacteria bacterium]